jgi:MFS family permease
MTNDSGTTAISPLEPPDAATAPAEAEAAAGHDSSDHSAGTPSPDDAPPPLVSGTPRAPAALAMAGLSLIWLMGMLWTARATIRSAGDAALAVFLAAYSLPAVISASLVAGVAVGLAVTNRLPDRIRERPYARSMTSTGAGLLTGLTGAGVITLSYGGGSAIMVLGGTVAAAATVGGALAGLRAATIVGAAVAASLGVFLIGVLFQAFRGGLLSLYGAGESASSQESARGLFAGTVALASGVVAGYVAYRYLRRATRHAPPRWPAYLAAGSGAGLTLLLTEAIIRIAGGPVLSLARSLSEIDASGLAWQDSARINYGLVVLFGGAITAIVAFGRTLPKPVARPSKDDDFGRRLRDQGL